jgi:bacterioferritin-associated ferredoxin
VFACICRAVTDERVCAAIDQGATTVEAVGRATRAGTGCGTCREHLADLIGERRQQCPFARLEVASGASPHVPAGMMI